jgi:phage-related protein
MMFKKFAGKRRPRWAMAINILDWPMRTSARYAWWLPKYLFIFIATLAISVPAYILFFALWFGPVAILQESMVFVQAYPAEVADLVNAGFDLVQIPINAAIKVARFFYESVKWVLEAWNWIWEHLMLALEVTIETLLGSTPPTGRGPWNYTNAQLAAPFNTILDVLGSIYDILEWLIENMISWTTSTWNSFVGAIKKIWNAIVLNSIVAFEAIATGVDSIKNELEDFVTWAIDVIWQNLKTFGQTIVDMFLAFKDYFLIIVEFTVDYIITIANYVWDYLTTAVDCIQDLKNCVCSVLDICL